MRSWTRALALLAALAPGLEAAAPQILSLQGRLEDPAGTPMTGPVTLTLNVYTVDSGGVAQHSEDDIVSFDAAGNFVTSLGDPPAPTLDATLFAQQLWVGVQVDGGGELSPRLPLRAAPYALRATVAEDLLPGATVDMNSQVLSNVAGPSGASDAANKDYVDTELAAHTSDLANPHQTSLEEARLVNNALSGPIALTATGDSTFSGGGGLSLTGGGALSVTNGSISHAGTGTVTLAGATTINNTLDLNTNELQDARLVNARVKTGTLFFDTTSNPALHLLGGNIRMDDGGGSNGGTINMGGGQIIAGSTDMDLMDPDVISGNLTFSTAAVPAILMNGSRIDMGTGGGSGGGNLNMNGGDIHMGGGTIFDADLEDPSVVTGTLRLDSLATIGLLVNGKRVDMGTGGGSGGGTLNMDGGTLNGGTLANNSLTSPSVDSGALTFGVGAASTGISMAGKDIEMGQGGNGGGELHMDGGVIGGVGLPVSGTDAARLGDLYPVDTVLPLCASTNGGTAPGSCPSGWTDRGAAMVGDRGCRYCEWDGPF